MSCQPGKRILVSNDDHARAEFQYLGVEHLGISTGYQSMDRELFPVLAHDIKSAGAD
jgi:hypothetical protein